MYKMSYKEYFNKVYGCFLGKTIFGTLGAPYEGIKMPMNLEFSRSLIDVMIPNDDLDLQILWLEVFEKKGHSFTSFDLLKKFCENCDYSPGEYSVMRKNFMKGIYPPLSGEFCNDFYREGMGSPIRSEIWACLAAGNPNLAAEYADRDAVIDHSGNSVYAERFLAALESMAFFVSDLDELMEFGLQYVPSDSRMHALITYSIRLSKTCDSYKKALFLLLQKFGHPDCTNVFQNIGIIILALYFGENDFIKANMLAVNSGFDTDCTCATIGSIMGIIHGADYMVQKYELEDTKYVLSVRADRRSDSVYDLSEDIAYLGYSLFSDGLNNRIEITAAPPIHCTFDPKASIECEIRYEDDIPAIELGGSRKIALILKNNTETDKTYILEMQSDSNIILTGLVRQIEVKAKSEALISLEVTLDLSERIIFEKNIFNLTVRQDGEDGILFEKSFGLSGAVPYKVYGPFWKTNPQFTEEQIANLGKQGYFTLFEPHETTGRQIDSVRNFHINFDLGDDEYVSHEVAFSDADHEDYTQHIVNIYEDSFYLDSVYEMQGPTTGYLLRKLYTEEDKSVSIQFGYTDPFELYINGELLLKSSRYDIFTSENLHLTDVLLKKGENDILIRFTKTTPNAKMSMIFSKGPTCDEHFVCFGTINPRYYTKAGTGTSQTAREVSSR